MGADHSSVVFRLPIGTSRIIILIVPAVILSVGLDQFFSSRPVFIFPVRKKITLTLLSQIKLPKQSISARHSNTTTYYLRITYSYNIDGGYV